MSKLRLEYIDPADLGKNPRNWKIHGSKQLKALDAAIDELGWAGALLYNEKTKRLLDGHARKELFEGKGKVPVLIGSWDEKTERKILATLDPLTSLDSDQQMLAELLEGVEANNFELQEVMDDMLDKAIDPFPVIYKKISDLKNHPKNYKEHPDDQIEHIIYSIKNNGFLKNIIISLDNVILAGHGVVKAARQMGKTKIPVIQLEIKSDDPKALKVIASDNEISRLALVNDEDLCKLLFEVLEDDGLEGSGFNEDQLNALAMVSRPPDQIKDKNENDHLIGMEDFSTESDEPWHKVIVSFENEDDFLKFQKSLGIELEITNRSIWFPIKDRDDVSSIRFDINDEYENDQN